MKIAIIKEGKIPADHRVPFTPHQVKTLIETYPQHNFVVQSSSIRAFKDEEYSNLGIAVKEDVSDCDAFFGVKEVPLQDLIPEKTYFFFSHTIKMQPYNKQLLQTVLEKKITLIDYETLKKDGQRVVAFGRWAGIVGAYNALRTYGLKYKSFELKPAHQCYDMQEMKAELSQAKLGSVKIVLTGGGRVSQGAEEILAQAGIEKINVDTYLNQTFAKPVYVQLDTEDYNKTKNGEIFSTKEFYTQPEKFEGNFKRFLPHTDLLIAGAYWDPKAPVLFEKSDLQHKNFKIRVVADITCDIEGSVPTTIRPTTIAAPFYDICLDGFTEKPPFSAENNLTVMAIDNLPCELPRDASQSFGDQLLQNVIPHFLGKDEHDVIHKATIANQGKLTDLYNYLNNWIVE